MGNESWVVSGPQLITVTTEATVGSLDVAINSGAVHVEAWDGPGVELEVREVSERPIAMTLEGDAVHVAYEFAGLEGLVDRVRGLRNKDSADVVVRVPPAVTVKVSTLRASVRLTGLAGVVTVSSVDGTVELNGVAASASISTVAGAVRVAQHEGPVTVKTGAGAVDIGGELTRAEVNTVSGPVLVRAGTRACVLSVKTASSRIDVQIPAGLGVDVRARAVSGKVLLDGTDLRRSGSRTTTVDHVEPDARIFLSTNTISGDVVVARDV